MTTRKNRIRRKKIQRQQRYKREIRGLIDRRKKVDVNPLLKKIGEQLREQENQRRRELKKHPELYWKELGNEEPKGE